MKHRSFLKKQAPLYIITMILDQLLVAICYNTVLAYILKYVTDAIITKDGRQLKIAFLLAMISFTTAFTLEPIVSRINKYSVKTAMSKLREETFEHASKLTLEAMEEAGTGEILSRLTLDVDTVESIYKSYIPNFVFAVLFGIISIIMMLQENLILAAYSITIGVLSVLIANRTSKKISNHSEQYQKEASNLTKTILDIEDGFMDMKMNTSEGFFFNRFRNTNKALTKAFRKREFCMAGLSISSQLFGNLNHIGLMILGLYLTFSGHITVGGVLAIIHLNGNASYLFQNFSSFLGGIKKNLPSIKRVGELLDMPIEDIDRIRSENLKQIEENKTNASNINDAPILQVSNLSFSYPSRKEQNILDQISFTIGESHFVSLEGASGSGKSTLLKILLGFYENNTGSLRIKGQERNEMSLREWRSNISYVPQDCYLYELSVKENIRLGRLDATDDEIIKASKLALAHDFIMELENGYDTVLTNQASNISGGQKQRIAIARALLRGSSFLIFDEGTSALDPAMELQMKEMLHQYKKDKGILFISHRKAMIEGADVRLKLVNGHMNEKA